jgi:TolA-binding protein
MGRRSTRAASTAISKYRQSQSASMGARQDQETVQALQREVQELEQELQDQVSGITARWDDAVSRFESIPVRPSRSDVRVDMFALAWAPHWQIKYKAKDDSERDEIVPAYV